MELWDALSWKPIKYFGVYKEEGAGDLLAVGWHAGGTGFVTTHAEGVLLFWDSDQSQPLKAVKPHGRYLFEVKCYFNL